MVGSKVSRVSSGSTSVVNLIRLLVEMGTAGRVIWATPLCRFVGGAAVPGDGPPGAVGDDRRG